MPDIRPAAPPDIPAMSDLLLRAAHARAERQPGLWRVVPDADTTITATLLAALQDKAPSFRQQWLVAETGGRIVGLTHSILLPVPPIYAGRWGAPGLIMENSTIAPDAPRGLAQQLLKAAEDDLRAAGAQLLIGAAATGWPWAAEYAARGYAPLTLYYAREGLAAEPTDATVRQAAEGDLPGIVASSAQNRKILFDLDPFWEPHIEADPRFESWMRRSLTLTDRDMFVSAPGGRISGYAIAQPATALHVPAGHAAGGLGFIDDYFHTDFAVQDGLENGAAGATALLRAAEAALAARDNSAALVVCPAAWTAKRAHLQQAGYSAALSWHIKRPTPPPQA
ncbi:GNAT family N-acetyltransferase [Actibacterium ureilyticum]|uniref:GNAT family N-acetyltransferase n=1 Tax=Actibacterium ureilyticum TaxID=1590614 RepID=UPI000BAAAF29|nr:GNAT family N-acetyltransferase [Actibacterium ureilyticum]